MEEKLIAEHTYEFDLGSDEEIKSFLKENGMPDINPDVIRDYIKSSMYKTFCETMYSKEQLDKLVDATNFARMGKVMEWISVKDRLPETMDDVLCWYEYMAMDGTHEGEMINKYGIGYYFKQSKTWGGEVSCGRNAKVIAWMPLPEPFENIN